MQKLEDECDWYRKEALRLDSFNTVIKKDLKYMKGKLQVLGELEVVLPLVLHDVSCLSLCFDLKKNDN